MNKYTLRHKTTNRILFEGKFGSFKDCLENAVIKNTDLSNINLRHQNLTNANIDDAIMPSADLRGANLTGTNLSESYLKGACFKNATLHNTCLCYAEISACDFQYSSFGATDIVGATMNNSTFSSLSCFSLNFTSAKDMKGCKFIEENGQCTKMSHPPIVIHGLQMHPLIILDDTTKLNQTTTKNVKTRPLLERVSNKITPTKTQHKNNHWLTIQNLPYKKT